MKDVSAVQSRLVQLVFLVLALAAWFVVGRTQAISPLFLPPLEAVFQALGQLVQTTEFWSAVGVTLSTIARAYLIACVLGIGVAYLVTRSHFLTRLLEPVISNLFIDWTPLGTNWRARYCKN